MTPKLDRSNGLRWRRGLVGLLGSCLLVGCGPGGAGSIAVDPNDPAVRGFKSFEDTKKSRGTKITRAPVRRTDGPRNGHR
jgi:hypothetical protein